MFVADPERREKGEGAAHATGPSEIGQTGSSS